MLYDGGIISKQIMLNGGYNREFYSGDVPTIQTGLSGSGSPVQTNTAAIIVEGVKVLEETPILPTMTRGVVQPQTIIPRETYFRPTSIDLGRGDQSFFQKKTLQTGKEQPIVTTKTDEEKETRKILIYGFLLVATMIGLGFFITRIKV